MKCVIISLNWEHLIHLSGLCYKDNGDPLFPGITFYAVGIIVILGYCITDLVRDGTQKARCAGLRCAALQVCLLEWSLS